MLYFIVRFETRDVPEPQGNLYIGPFGTDRPSERPAHNWLFENGFRQSEYSTDLQATLFIRPGTTRFYFDGQEYNVENLRAWIKELHHPDFVVFAR